MADEVVEIIEEEIPEGQADPDHPIERDIRELKERATDLRRNGEGAYRAMVGWSGVKTEQDWADLCERARENFLDGSFMIQRLGAERHVDPELTATLLILRQDMIEQEQASGAAELMLVDAAVMCFAHMVRAQGWLGDLALFVEHDLFARDCPTAQLGERYNVQGFTAEQHMRDIEEKILPIIARVNKMLHMNLRAIRDLRRSAAPVMMLQKPSRSTLRR